MSSVIFGLSGEFLDHVFPNSSEPFIVNSCTSKMNLSDVLMLKDLALIDEKKDYNFDLSHHLGKANVVVNAVSIKYSYVDLRDLSLVCEITLKSMKLGMLKKTSDLMEGSREG
ncbi:hypothetical protein CR513_40994, partial [Mucuna pruriens]